jgi:transcriptional regulator with XRE-family HTH domain
MLLVEQVQKLCDSKGINIANLQKELGFSNGTIYRWDKSLPSVDKLQKVADYFNVSTDYLLGKEPPPTEHKYIDVPLDPETLGIMCRIPLLNKNNKAVISDMIDSMIKNQK